MILQTEQKSRHHARMFVFNQTEVISYVRPCTRRVTDVARSAAIRVMCRRICQSWEDEYGDIIKQLHIFNGF